MTIPFHRNMPQGLIPAAFAQGDPLAGKIGLTLLNDRPVNAETPAELLDDLITPTDRHFIRNNGNPPETRTPRPGRSRSTASWTSRWSSPSPICATASRWSARRSPSNAAETGARFSTRPRAATSGRVGAVGCSEWTGVRLKDVLEAAGVQSNVIYTAHYGADTHLSGDADKEPISRGLPIEKALTDNILIAFAMNGADLHPMNGAPLRLVVPGWPGSCSQKWLTRIELRDQVHDGAKMTGTSYRVPAYPVAPGADVPEEDFVIIERMPVKSLVTFPANGAESGLQTEVRGHAWSGDRTITDVEVSIDFGATWMPVDLDDPANDGAWQNWRTQIAFPQAGYYEVWARATDSEGVMQPFAIDWNPKGYLNNTMHRVGLFVA